VQNPPAQSKLPLPFWNAFAGTIVSFQIPNGGEGVRCRILTDCGVMLSGILSVPRSGQPEASAGQRILAMVSAHDVVLVAPGCRPVNEQWNQWPGRIVLVEPGQGMPVITVKIIGQRRTLKSMPPVLGRDRPPRTWDSVIIATDPGKVYVKVRHQEQPYLRPRVLQLTS
jgi:hypothetical protein